MFLTRDTTSQSPLPEHSREVTLWMDDGGLRRMPPAQTVALQLAVRLDAGAQNGCSAMVGGG